MAQPYQLLGWHLSYYTGKVLCYLRYKGIPFEGPRVNAWNLGRQIPKRFGASVMPVVITPEGEWMQDSSAIIDHLEARHTERSIHPEGAVARFASYLLEAWGDEWWIPVAMHSRWSYPENRSLFTSEAGGQLLPGFPAFVQRKAGEVVAGKLEAMLQGAGVRQAQFAALEAWTAQTLDQLDAHFGQHDFLLGNTPSLGDFGLVGTFYGHLARDPWPLREWVSKRTHLHRWVARMAEPQQVHQTAQWAVAPTLTPIFQTIFSEFGAMVEQTNAQVSAAMASAPGASGPPGATGATGAAGVSARLLRRGLRDVAIDTPAGTIRRSALPFTVWKAQRVLDVFVAMAPAAQLQVRQWAATLGGEAFLNLDLVRLERVGLRVRPAANPR